MSDFVCWLLLVLTAGSLAPVASTDMRRSLSCEEQLQAVAIDPAVCEKIRSAVSKVSRAVLDIDAQISKSAKEAIEEATKILRSSTALLKSQLPMYLKRKRRSVEKQKREVPDVLADFHALAKKVASSAVSAVKDGSKEIRDVLFNTMVALHSSKDRISEAARYILGKVMSKRSVTDEAVSQAIFNISVEMKASMTKAVLTALSGFKDLMNNMEVKMKTLLQGVKLQVGFFDPGKAQIAELADQVGKDLVDFYDNSAMKSVNDAIIKVNDLMIAVYVIEKSNPDLNALFTLRSVTEKESQAVKDAIHADEVNPEEGVALAMQKAADQMESDYKDLVRIINNA